MISRQLPNGATVFWRKGFEQSIPPMPSLASMLLNDLKGAVIKPPVSGTRHHGKRRCKACGEPRKLTEMVQLGKSKDYVFCIGKCADDRQAKIDARGW